MIHQRLLPISLTEETLQRAMIPPRLLTISPANETLETTVIYQRLLLISPNTETLERIMIHQRLSLISPTIRGWSKSKEEGGLGENGRLVTKFPALKGLGHPIFQPVVVEWVMIVSDKVHSFLESYRKVFRDRISCHL